MSSDTFITEKYLKEHPNHIFVFGDNLERKGTGGAARLRHMENTYGFITKKQPLTASEAYYTPEEYEEVFRLEASRFIHHAIANPTKTFLLSKIGAGLANKHRIFEQVIAPNLWVLCIPENVRLLFVDF